MATGVGGSAGLSSAVNAAAKSFPDKTRASATGTVLAGFGLSAFFFSLIGHYLFEGDAGGLLMVLTFGTSLPMFLGSFLVKPIPQVEGTDGYDPLPHHSETPEIFFEDADNTHQRPSFESPPASRRTSKSYPRSRTSSLELTRSVSPTPRGRALHAHFADLPEVEDDLVSPSPVPSPALPPYRPRHSQHTRSSSASLPPTAIHHSPLDLLLEQDFYILFAVLALLCGTGLMYINNVGTVALALAREGRVEYDGKVVGHWQARQVATVSIWNCTGRILGGSCF
jgi:hypothetical protein